MQIQPLANIETFRSMTANAASLQRLKELENRVGALRTALTGAMVQHGGGELTWSDFGSITQAAMSVGEALSYMGARVNDE